MFDYSDPCRDIYGEDFLEVDYGSLENGGVYCVTARLPGEPDMRIFAQFLRRGTTIISDRADFCKFPRIAPPEEVLLREMFIQRDGLRMDIVPADGFFTKEERYIPTVKPEPLH